MLTSSAFTKPTLQTYAATREDLVKRSGALFAALGSGIVRCEVKRRFALRDAAKAHRALAARETTGSSVLIP